jgi:serine/threonine-protein kinase
LGRLTVSDSIHVLRACARALGHAHSINLVHRDIKPENVLLSAKGVVKVADLGLAKSRADDMSLTRTGTGVGTPLYMSPEQIHDAKHVDGRSDIYSLGCMIYHLVTGLTPFPGGHILVVFKAKEKGQFLSAHKVNAQVPERLSRVLNRMIARDPEQRYPTCAELIADLDLLGLTQESPLSFLATNKAK